MKRKLVNYELINHFKEELAINLTPSNPFVEIFTDAECMHCTESMKPL